MQPSTPCWTDDAPMPPNLSPSNQQQPQNYQSHPLNNQPIGSQLPGIANFNTSHYVYQPVIVKEEPLSPPSIQSPPSMQSANPIQANMPQNSPAANIFSPHNNAGMPFDQMQRHQFVHQPFQQHQIRLNDLLTKDMYSVNQGVPIFPKQEFPMNQQLPIKQEFPAMEQNCTGEEEYQRHVMFCQQFGLQPHPNFPRRPQYQQQSIFDVKQEVYSPEPAFGYQNTYGMVPAVAHHPQEMVPNASRATRREYTEEELRILCAGESINMVHVISSDPTFEYPEIKYDENQKWADVTAYEENTMEPCATFTTNVAQFVVDGSFYNEGKENSDRFGIGATISHSNPAITKVAKCIGKGIQIVRKPNGDVVLTNIGLKSTVFVQSYNYSRRNKNPNETVYRIPAVHNAPDEKDRQLKIYEAAEFPIVVSTCKTNKDLGDLTNNCYVRVSFLKGFGKNYPNRPTIKECPIWIQLRLPEALEILDRKFQELSASDPNFFL